MWELNPPSLAGPSLARWRGEPRANLCSKPPKIMRRKARESNPHALGAPSFQDGPATRIRLPSVSVDPPGFEPGLPACRADVLPLDDEPTEWRHEESNPLAQVHGLYRPAMIPLTSASKNPPTLTLPHEGGGEQWAPPRGGRGIEGQSVRTVGLEPTLTGSRNRRIANFPTS